MAQATRTIRGEVYAVTNAQRTGDGTGRTQWQLVKQADGSVWSLTAKGITPYARLTAIAAPAIAAPVQAAPVQAAPARRSKIVIVNGADGLTITGTPYPLRWRVSKALRPLGWDFDRDARRVWFLPGSVSMSSDVRQEHAGAAAFALAEAGIEIDDYATNGAAPAQRAKAAAPVQAAPVQTDLAERIAVALHGMPTDVVAAAILAATTHVKATARAQRAKAAAPVQAAPDGGRLFTLAEGTRVRAFAKAARSALYASQRGQAAPVAFHVYADRDARTLRVVASVDSPTVWDAVAATLANVTA